MISLAFDKLAYSFWIIFAFIPLGCEQKNRRETERNSELYYKKLRNISKCVGYKQNTERFKHEWKENTIRESFDSWDEEP